MPDAPHGPTHGDTVHRLAHGMPDIVHRPTAG
ncbi:hypothetical protein BJ992_001054 [Sphaerisporangium rubeum]|uniref:Uncharacterized protein n=1 Tax=Sphaerisporangium rubeum TaxID=321317 RepID=A0A7X0IAT1_9ACTN|nr:hypothetical protein [Sphaerisporangium rubeum]